MVAASARGRSGAPIASSLGRVADEKGGWLSQANETAERLGAGLPAATLAALAVTLGDANAALAAESRKRTRHRTRKRTRHRTRHRHRHRHRLI